MLRLFAAFLLAVLMLLPQTTYAEVILASETVGANLDYVPLDVAKHAALTNAIRAAHRNPCYDGQKISSRINVKPGKELTEITVTIVSETCGSAQ